MRRPARVEIRSPAAIPIVLALLAAALILLAVYPGFMSYDSVRALHEARTGVVGGTYPPFVSYVWRVFDFIWPGPALMLLVQNFLLVASFAAVLRAAGYRSAAITALVATFCVAPVILGPMLAVWKDVAVSACFCAAVACFLLSEHAANPRAAIIAGVAALFCGAAFRLNAMSAVVPLVIWLCWQRGFQGWQPRTSIAVGAAIVVAIASAVVVVNRYRFPDFTPLQPSDGAKSIMIFDLAAMSAETGRNLMPDAGPVSEAADLIDYLRRIHDVRHNELVAANDVEGRLGAFFAVPEPLVQAAYFETLRREPRAYLERRWLVFRELVGLTGGPTFYPTQVGVVPNDEGIVHRPTRLTARVLDYIWAASHMTLGKPWLYYLLGTIALAIAVARRKNVLCAAALAVYASGALYILPFFFISPAADVRYNHWSVVCMFIAMALAAAPSRDAPGVRVELPA
jgi:hypothetical protein